MRLLLISAAHHPDHGGIGTAVSSFVRRATDAGWHIELVTRPSDRLPQCARVHTIETRDMSPEFHKWIEPLRRIHRIRPYRYGLWALAVAKRLLTIGGEFDAIEFVDSQAEGVVALTSARVRDRWQRVPMCISAHSPMWLIERLNGANLALFGRHVYHEWERQALVAADGVRAPSRVLLDALQPVQSHAIMPPMVPEMAAPPRRDRKPSIAFIGNLEPNKGVDVWTRSLNIVLKRHRDVGAVVVGRDTPTAPDGSSMHAYCQSLLEPEVAPRVTFAGQLEPSQVQRLMQSASLVVVPSRFESFSYVACEAILLETPVIVTDSVGINEYLPELDSVPFGDVEALARTQCNLLHDPAAAVRNVAGHRGRLLSACQPSRVLNRLREFLHTIHTAAEPRASGLDAIDTMDELLREIENRAVSNLGKTVAATPSLA